METILNNYNLSALLISLYLHLVSWNACSKINYLICKFFIIICHSNLGEMILIPILKTLTIRSLLPSAYLLWACPSFSLNLLLFRIIRQFQKYLLQAASEIDNNQKIMYSYLTIFNEIAIIQIFNKFFLMKLAKNKNIIK